MGVDPAVNTTADDVAVNTASGGKHLVDGAIAVDDEETEETAKIAPCFVELEAEEENDPSEEDETGDDEDYPEEEEASPAAAAAAAADAAEGMEGVQQDLQTEIAAMANLHGPQGPPIDAAAATARVAGFEAAEGPIGRATTMNPATRLDVLGRLNWDAVDVAALPSHVRRANESSDSNNAKIPLTARIFAGNMLAVIRFHENEGYNYVQGVDKCIAWCKSHGFVGFHWQDSNGSGKKKLCVRRRRRRRRRR